jgi:hypothetical protein
MGEHIFIALGDYYLPRPFLVFINIQLEDKPVLLFAQAQISHWEENLERLQVEQFRLRCYMASLQAGELPNPKVKEYFLHLFSVFLEQR